MYLCTAQCMCTMYSVYVLYLLSQITWFSTVFLYLSTAGRLGVHLLALLRFYDCCHGVKRTLTAKEAIILKFIKLIERH